jgi:hypothetical protein
MSEAKHTPGPWAAFSDEINDHTNIVSIADRTRLVLSLPGRHKSDPDVRLIAAAPELLEALELILEALEEAVELFGCPDGTWIDMAKNAITKARVERP